MPIVPLALLVSAALLLNACSSDKPASKARQEQLMADSMLSNKKPDIALAAKTYVQLGLAYLEQGQTVRAKVKLTRALELKPKDAEVLSAWAVYSELTGELEEAKKFHNLAVSVSKPEQEANIYRAQGDFLCRQGDWEKADQSFQYALRNKRALNTAEVYEHAGICAASFQKKDLAEDYFGKAIDRDPNRTIALLSLATLKVEKKAFHEAYPLLRAYQFIGPKNAKWTWLTLQTAEALGQTEKVADFSLQMKTKFRDTPEYREFVQRRLKPSIGPRPTETAAMTPLVPSTQETPVTESMVPEASTTTTLNPSSTTTTDVIRDRE